MTDKETLERLAKDLQISVNSMRKKIKYQRLENGRLNKVLSEAIADNKQLTEQLKWIRGDG